MLNNLRLARFWAQNATLRSTSRSLWAPRLVGAKQTSSLGATLPAGRASSNFATSSDNLADFWQQERSTLQRMLQERDALQTQLHQDVEHAWAHAGRMAQHAQHRSRVQHGKGWQGYSWESSFREGGVGGYYSERLVVVAPQQAHALSSQSQPRHGLLSGLLALVAAFVAGAWAATTAAFWRGYHLTTYRDAKRWQLLALWPLLLVLSPRFREQFWAAVRGGREGAGKQGKEERDQVRHSGGT